MAPHIASTGYSPPYRSKSVTRECTGIAGHIPALVIGTVAADHQEHIVTLPAVPTTLTYSIPQSKT